MIKVLWKFHAYVSSHSSRYDVVDTIDGFDERAQARLSARLRYLAISPINLWNEPEAKKVKGQNSTLFEIRFIANKCQTRALGNFLSDGRGFVITLICNHKGKIYEPKNAFEIATQRFEEIISGDATYCPLSIDGETF